MDEKTLIIFYIAVAVAGFIYSAYTYHPEHGEHRPGLIAKLFYIIAGAVGMGLYDSIKKDRKK